MSSSRALVSEFLGTAFLLATVVGSGALAEKLAMGNIAICVLSVAFATGAVLNGLILAFASHSAHFNPISDFLANNQPNTATASSAPTIWAAINAGTLAGAIPVRVPVSTREIVTAGLAKQVDEVK